MIKCWKIRQAFSSKMTQHLEVSIQVERYITWKISAFLRVWCSLVAETDSAGRLWPWGSFRVGGETWTSTGHVFPNSWLSTWRHKKHHAEQIRRMTFCCKDFISLGCCWQSFPEQHIAECCSIPKQCLVEWCTRFPGFACWPMTFPSHRSSAGGPTGINYLDEHHSQKNEGQRGWCRRGAEHGRMLCMPWPRILCA